MMYNEKLWKHTHNIELYLLWIWYICFCK